MTRRIAYLGKKPYHADDWFDSGVSWYGHGDVQPVPEAAAEAMLRSFPEVYGPAPEDSTLPGHEGDGQIAEFGGGDAPPSAIDTIMIPDREGGEVSLREAKFVPLKDWVEDKFGVQIRIGTGKTELLDLVVQLLEAGKGNDTPPSEQSDPAAGSGDPSPPQE